MLDYWRGEFGTLVYRDGADVRDGRVAEYYFRPPPEWSTGALEALERLLAADGPVLDVGCGAGQHALWLEDRGVDVVGIDVSANAVRAARERGLEDACVMDMFEPAFESGRFRSIHAVGTQLGLAGSLAGIRDLLGAFGRVTDDGAIAVVDNYDPTDLDGSILGYRPDPREGVAHRCFHFEYEREVDGEPVREVGESLHFLLCSPDRLREATVGTPWVVDDVNSSGGYYRATLSKA